MTRKTIYLISFLLCAFSLLQAATQNDQQFSAKAQERITKEVRHKLIMLPQFGTFDNIEFKLNGYDVVLLGQVHDPTLRTDAEREVKKVEGVEHVENRLEVLPTSPNDDRIRRAVFIAIYRYGPLQRYGIGSNRPIHIIVNNGHVTLVGVVDRESDKSLVGIRANGVDGVFSVQNDLMVPEKRR